MEIKKSAFISAENKKKNKQLNFRVTSVEFDDLENICKHFKIDKTSWLNLMIKESKNLIQLDK